MEITKEEQSLLSLDKLLWLIPLKEIDKNLIVNILNNSSLKYAVVDNFYYKLLDAFHNKKTFFICKGNVGNTYFKIENILLIVELQCQGLSFGFTYEEINNNNKILLDEIIKYCNENNLSNKLNVFLENCEIPLINDLDTRIGFVEQRYKFLLNLKNININLQQKSGVTDKFLESFNKISKTLFITERWKNELKITSNELLYLNSYALYDYKKNKDEPISLKFVDTSELHYLIENLNSTEDLFFLTKKMKSYLKTRVLKRLTEEQAFPLVKLIDLIENIPSAKNLKQWIPFLNQSFDMPSINRHIDDILPILVNKFNPSLLDQLWELPNVDALKLMTMSNSLNEYDLLTKIINRNYLFQDNEHITNLLTKDHGMFKSLPLVYKELYLSAFQNAKNISNIEKPDLNFIQYCFQSLVEDKLNIVNNVTININDQSISL